MRRFWLFVVSIVVVGGACGTAEGVYDGAAGAGGAVGVDAGADALPSACSDLKGGCAADGG